MGKDLIIGGLIRNMRKQEKAPKDKFKHLVKLRNVIDFTWWDLYGKGQAERVIVSTDSEGRPQVKFKDTYWTIEWIEIVDIKEHGWYTKERIERYKKDVETHIDISLENDKDVLWWSVEEYLYHHTNDCESDWEGEDDCDCEDD